MGSIVVETKELTALPKARQGRDYVAGVYVLEDLIDEGRFERRHRRRDAQVLQAPGSAKLKNKGSMIIVIVIIINFEKKTTA